MFALMSSQASGHERHDLREFRAPLRQHQQAIESTATPAQSGTPALEALIKRSSISRTAGLRSSQAIIRLKRLVKNWGPTLPNNHWRAQYRAHKPQIARQPNAAPLDDARERCLLFEEILMNTSPHDAMPGSTHGSSGGRGSRAYRGHQPHLCQHSQPRPSALAWSHRVG